jgi:hypothetical protein
MRNGLAVVAERVRQISPCPELLYQSNRAALARWCEPAVFDSLGGEGLGEILIKVDRVRIIPERNHRAPLPQKEQEAVLNELMPNNSKELAALLFVGKLHAGEFYDGDVARDGTAGPLGFSPNIVNSNARVSMPLPLEKWLSMFTQSKAFSHRNRPIPLAPRLALWGESDMKNESKF